MSHWIISVCWSNLEFMNWSKKWVYCSRDFYFARHSVQLVRVSQSIFRNSRWPFRSNHLWCNFFTYLFLLETKKVTIHPQSRNYDRSVKKNLLFCENNALLREDILGVVRLWWSNDHNHPSILLHGPHVLTQKWNIDVVKFWTLMSSDERRENVPKGSFISLFIAR